MPLCLFSSPDSCQSLQANYLYWNNLFAENENNRRKLGNEGEGGKHFEHACDNIFVKGHDSMGNL